MSKMSAAVGVAALFLLVDGKKGTPMQWTTPALMRTNESKPQPNANVYCDGTGKHYCDGSACCPDFLGGFRCASGADLWANCLIYSDDSCHGDSPIICGGHCCKPDCVCRHGHCYKRSVSKEDHAYALASTAGHLNMQLTQETPPLGWYPDISGWADGMLRTAHEGLHNMFLAVQANWWRRFHSSHTGQCWVIGFPAELGQCNKPWDDGCKGSAATIIQDGRMTLYNTDPIVKLVAYENLDWCNDDPHEHQSQTFKYSYKEAQTVSFTLSTTTKITAGVTSKTKFEESLVIAKASEELDFSFSVELDVSKSSTQTTSTERIWEEDLRVSVGPRSHVYSQCALSQGVIDSPYDLKVKLHTPIVWACTDPGKVHSYTYAQALWQSFNLEQHMQSFFGFSNTDLEAIFSAKTGGTFKAVMGQKIVCTTHTVPLMDGESCKPPGSKSNATLMFV